MVISQDFFSFRMTSTTEFALLWDPNSLFTEWIPTWKPTWVQDLVRCFPLASREHMRPGNTMKSTTSSEHQDQGDWFDVETETHLARLGMMGTIEQKLWESLGGRWIDGYTIGATWDAERRLAAQVVHLFFWFQEPRPNAETCLGAF